MNVIQSSQLLEDGTPVFLVGIAHAEPLGRSAAYAAFRGVMQFQAGVDLAYFLGDGLLCGYAEFIIHRYPATGCARQPLFIDAREVEGYFWILRQLFSRRAGKEQAGGEG